ncbi:hypothetical protein LX36DRAFT_719358 [Colletotrichum falcatum]|nr:hypothetical protein LX36DRAFT_719358 [Colletotrichum falcatum]
MVWIAERGDEVTLLTFPTTGLSTYAPTWAKIDCKSFHKLKRRKDICNDEGDAVGKTVHTTDCLSLFDSQLASSEQKAFRALMEHIGQRVKDHAIIMIQIESQIDLGKDAHFLKKEGSQINNSAYSWDSFGQAIERAEEVFTVYHLANHVETLARIVKDAWCTGASVPNNIHLWKSFAPSIDLYAPGVLHGNNGNICLDWSRKADQPLLVMAHLRNGDKIRQLWRAFGSYGAFGVATIPVDKVDPTRSPLQEHFGLMGRVTPILSAARNHGAPIAGFCFPSITATRGGARKPVRQNRGGFDLTIERRSASSFHEGGCGSVAHQGEGKVLAVAYGFQIKAKAVNPKATFTQALGFHKLEVNQDGGYNALRILNADAP